MRRSVVAITVAAGLVLSGCVAAPPTPGEAPSPSAQAALNAETSQSVIADTFAVLAAADLANSTADAGSRIGGDAAVVRQAEYTVVAAVPAEVPTVLPADMQAVFVTGENEWPRLLAAVSNAASPETTPVVYLWVQDSIDQNYTLRGWAHMLPGAVIPAMPNQVNGAQQFSVDEAIGDTTSKTVLETYLEYLRQGSASELAPQFSTDTYATRLFEARAALTASAQTASGTYVDTIQPSMEGTFVLATADGGALVFAPVAISSSFTVSGATLAVADQHKPLLQGSPTTSVTYDYRDFVVISIPGPGGESLPTVVAADHHLVAVK